MVYALDRRFLDDVALASKAQIDASSLWINALLLGPVIEYEFLASQPSSSLPPVRSVSSSPLSIACSQAIRDGRSTTNTSSTPQSFEFIRLPSDHLTNPVWKTFKRRLVTAATEAGFDSETAKGFLGVFGEMVSNVYLHSENPETGLAAYRFGEDGFEFTVADAGIGVLASLSQNPDFAELSDHAVALTKAVTEHQTRFGRGSGHGNGFRTVFRNLATLQGFLRFRSGDYTLDIEGTSLVTANAKPLQRADFRGFLMSVHCRA